MHPTTNDTVRKPRPRPDRTVRLTLVPDAAHESPGLVNITEGGKLTSFLVWAIPSDFGRAFRLEKFTTHRRGDDDAEYHVCLEGNGGTCECKGFLRWSHCRHVEALHALVNAGEL